MSRGMVVIPQIGDEDTRRKSRSRVPVLRVTTDHVIYRRRCVCRSNVRSDVPVRVALTLVAVEEELRRCRTVP